MTTPGRQKVLSSGAAPSFPTPTNFRLPSYLQEKKKKAFKLILLAPLRIAVSRMNNILFLWNSLTSFPVDSMGFSLSPPLPAQQGNWTASWWGKNFSLHSNQHFFQHFVKPNQGFPWQPLCVIKWSSADEFQNNLLYVRIFSEKWNPKYCLTF